MSATAPENGAAGSGWGLPARPVVADAGYGDAAGFRLGLQQRGLPYVLAVKAATSVYPAQAVPELLPYTPGRGRAPVPRYREPPASLKALVITAGRAAGRRVTWRHGSRTAPANPAAAMRSRFVALRVRPASRRMREGSVTLLTNLP
jgi:SRSO17 transposase